MNPASKKEILRSIPSVDDLASSDRGAGLAALYGRAALVAALRRVLGTARQEIAGGDTDENLVSPRSLLENAADLLADRAAPSLRRAVNATGVILHTGLGRAVLPPAAVAAIGEAIAGYCSLAVDPDTGGRGSRENHVREILRELTGAGDATVVNNNAAATMLILNTLARGREVIVSRGQLVEIGGSFRLPEIMEASGAILREVGTTNRTRLSDYESALGESTGALMRVHHGNYRITGFASEPGIAEIAALGRSRGIPVIDDLGSGALFELPSRGLQPEPVVSASVRAGASVACFSGDKLIGGPQSGIIVGDPGIVERTRKNPLARAMRVDKMTIAGLEATLKLFRDPENIARAHPVYRMLLMTADELLARAEKVARDLAGPLEGLASVSVSAESSMVGSGSLPGQTLPTRVLRLEPISVGAEEAAARLRLGEPPVFTRRRRDCVLLDFRTILPGEDTLVTRAILAVFRCRPGGASNARP